MQIHGSPLNGCRNMEKTVRWFFWGSLDVIREIQDSRRKESPG